VSEEEGENGMSGVYVGREERAVRLEEQWGRQRRGEGENVVF
jgi:hypothetical protein